MEHLYVYLYIKILLSPHSMISLLLRDNQNLKHSRSKSLQHAFITILVSGANDLGDRGPAWQAIVLSGGGTSLINL